MCQFEHEGKQIKLLSLRPKTGQLKQTFILTLLPTPTSLTSPPLIATVPSLFFTGHACHIHKLFPYCRRHLTIKQSLHLHLHRINMCTLHKEISDRNKWSNVRPTL